MKPITIALVLLSACILGSCDESEFESDYLLEKAQTSETNTRNDSIGDGRGQTAVSIVIDDDTEEVDIDFSLDL